MGRRKRTIPKTSPEREAHLAETLRLAWARIAEREAQEREVEAAHQREEK
jgi:hypothetical protein